MPFGNALSLFALYIVSVCGAFLFPLFPLLFSFYSWRMHLSSFVVLYVLLHAKHFSYFPHYLHLCMKPWPHTNTHTHTQRYLCASGWKHFLALALSLSLSLCLSLPPTLALLCLRLAPCVTFSIFFPTGIINGQRDRPPSCLGKWSKNKWMIEWKPRQLAKGENSSKKWPTKKAKSSSLKPMLAAPISGSSSEAGCS